MRPEEELALLRTLLASVRASARSGSKPGKIAASAIEEMIVEREALLPRQGGARTDRDESVKR
jgi:hypothetical protein